MTKQSEAEPYDVSVQKHKTYPLIDYEMKICL